ncbi:hypothetical protein K435DRAFT_961677 [Dendrothele bispora CBS 962.96]|uniref:Rad21/Rec8-like protein N-terminal domain-containing protein n=1 Tax=Dendrothele bispora (strain CBS 962.96) TaxID=1314807 RepID=A0A4S8MRI0_DENBC|nr:hypothetical protein K435DRAFT_961677 [Dendrothele bispora CBS 962.96]
MFFSPELLARRDSGFGLLWLAATLGSKSTFKRLPKKSVLTADISQLCDLIAQPEEPLALRLSSNLMVGVARVYKVKQELFMSDVTNCVSSLKKVVQELQSKPVTDTMLQMAQPVVRPATLNITADPDAAYMIEFDALVADWDEFLNVGESAPRQSQILDDDYFPEDRSAHNKADSKAKKPDSTLAEDVRADMCTLKEHHDHLLSNSLDLSFQGSGGGLDVSSSQQGDVGFQPAGDNFFLDDLGIDLGLGDELARELGEGWGGSPTRNNPQLDTNPYPETGEMGMDLGLDFAIDPVGGTPMDIVQEEVFFNGPAPTEADVPMEVLKTPSRKKIKTSSALRKENQTPRPREKSLPPVETVLSPAASFSRQFLSQADGPEPTPPPMPSLHGMTSNNNNDQLKKDPNQRKQKRTRLLLDARTELTDDELKSARAQYLESQNELRRDMYSKKLEKNSGRIIEEMIWGVPVGIEAPVLIDFWQENFKVQVEAKTGIVRLHTDDDRPTKRRKVREQVDDVPELEDPRSAQDHIPNDSIPEAAMEFGLGLDFDDGGLDNGFYRGAEPEPIHTLRSSEEPGQGRQNSRPPSAGGDFNFEPDSNDLNAGSQRSSLFPWDNAGAGTSSSVDLGPDRVSVDRAETRIRSSPIVNSRRDSPFGFSQTGSFGRGLSPADLGNRGSQTFGEDFVFDGVEDSQAQGNTRVETQTQTQRTEVDLAALEKNSFNFLEYVKMQVQAMPTGTKSISFDHIVPKATSTRHVAAVGFYHCLVLGTRNFMRLEQNESYAAISISLVP